MRFCTNCGKKIPFGKIGKICPCCGAKQNSSHHYCEWCGNPTNPQAVICTSCKEKIKPSSNVFAVIFGIILILAGYFSSNIIVFIVFGIPLILFGISFMPFVKRILTELTVNKKVLRKTFLTIRTVAAILVLSMALIINLLTISSGPIKLYTSDAVDAAEIVFHRNVKLKNEESYVLNDYDVDVERPYNGDENWAEVTVVLDYSAMNSFGGMTRDEYTVTIYFNYEDGKFYDRVNSTLPIN